MNSNRISFVAGVSGGHILPALNLAYDYQQKNPATRILFITTDGKLDTTIMRNALNITHATMRIHPVPYKAWYKLPLFIYQFLLAFAKSVHLFLREKPNQLITTGSHVAIPVCAAAWLLRIPIELIALDVEPGKTLMALAPLATSISTCFTQTHQYFPRTQCVLRPYPLSNIIRSVHATRDELIHELGFDLNKKTILIVGGSQGSVSLNSAIQKLLSEYPTESHTLQFIHQTGSFDNTDWKALYAAHGITAHAFAYDPQLVRYYAAADCIITRAGSGSLHEIVHLKKQCIVIPLITSTTQHQRANASAIRERHPDLVQVVEQDSLEKDAGILMRAIAVAIRSVSVTK